jgi:hypothetical protein
MLEKRKRTRLDIAQSTYAALKSVANDRRQSMANALHDAVELLERHQEVQEQGGKMIAIGKGAVEWTKDAR